MNDIDHYEIRQEAIIVLRAEGWSVEKIAAVISRKPAYVTRCLDRARKLAKDRLEFRTFPGCLALTPTEVRAIHQLGIRSLDELRSRIDELKTIRGIGPARVQNVQLVIELYDDNERYRNA